MAGPLEQTETLSSGANARGRRPGREFGATLEPDFELRPRGLGELLDLGSEVLVRRFFALFVPAFVLWLPSALLMTLGGERTSETILGSLLPAIVNFMTSMLVSASVALTASRALRGEHIPASESLRECARHLPALLVATVATTFMVILGVIACFVPAIYFAWRFSLAQVVVVLEPVGPFAAMQRSSRLVRGSASRWFGIVALSILFTLPFSTGAGYVTEYGPGSLLADYLPFVPEVLRQLVAVLLLSLFFGFQSSLSAVLMTAYYVDCRVRLEALDLFERLGVLQARRADDATPPARATRESLA